MIKPVHQTNPVNQHHTKEQPKSEMSEFDQVLSGVMSKLYEEHDDVKMDKIKTIQTYV
ncbi:hypothetical protein [Vibrio phage pTD1]|uniref:Uncharacterized protein n=1 Tax=Vibrio phage pTD1 TaxID=1938577 RepID=A0A1Q2U2U3_9CAUD|nr:hypothetical protein FDH33_gp077 [Vibrio phage pTD1]BAW98286.1 hypothetical protein [Vibrio phage pTD1]